ncbi:hypothetical protein TRV_01206 [Trichophyton verrucosum HKI 0517]|uniref:Uncharacterized protein n=1 Tax=Trichophyton verrucosum (strain HKI 0517) TaxID=663202 RepID=D4D2A2_TRIVH|nr:uncharacterized protein TRV_01206 [Trichophyton verrucosum HKI 0517]EFE44026.1 hypothetical protein TRV_01206 [Trichophyton verrucosum HKI 0517]
MMNIFGLNGHASPDNPDIGWAGIDVPEYSKPYLNTLSALRDAVRRLTKSNAHITSQTLGSIINTIGSSADLGHSMSDLALPYVEVLRKFKDQIASLNLGTTEVDPNQLLSGCAIIRPVTSDLIKTRQGQTERKLQAQKRKVEEGRKQAEKMEKGRLSPYEMFRTDEFTAWDQDGVPTKDSEGKDLSKTRVKKLRKDWERKKKLQEAWMSAASKPTHDLFSYTSGRFLYNESARLRERYVEFDVTALKEAVTKHTGAKVTNLAKLGEGGFNRVLNATLENGLQLVVKIPYPLSVPRKYATASEVATLTFLRSKGIPVPKVYGWSATDENAVGAEYVIMELASGIGLDTRWFSMTKKQQQTVALGIVGIEKTLFDIPFGSIGSLYFKEDLPLELQHNLYLPGASDPDGDCNTFCIGPIADYMFWYGKRSELKLDRGPWSDPCQYLRAIGNRELEWTKKYGNPLEKEFPYNTLLPGTIPHEKYAALLEKYLAIAPFFLPKDPLDPGNQPTIRHPGIADLTPANVIVSPDTFDITCIIDWQHAVITPLLLAAGHPKMFENPDVEPPETLEVPKPPEGYDTLDIETKSQVDELLRRRYLHYLYRVFNGARNKSHLSAFYDPVLQPRQHLVDHAGRQWSGNIITLRGALMRMCGYWPLLSTKEECPISFTDAELKKHSEDEAMWFDLTALVHYWRDELGGLSEEGWIRSEMFDHAMKRNKELQEKFINDADPDEVEMVEANVQINYRREKLNIWFKEKAQASRGRGEPFFYISCDMVIMELTTPRAFPGSKGEMEGLRVVVAYVVLFRTSVVVGAHGTAMLDTGRRGNELYDGPKAECRHCIFRTPPNPRAQTQDMRKTVRHRDVTVTNGVLGYAHNCSVWTQEHLMPCEQRNLQLEELNLLILFLVTVMMVAKGPKEQGCEQKLIYFPQGNLGQLGPKAVSAAAASEYWKAK